LILYWILRSGLWRSLDREKVSFFFGWTDRTLLSRQRPLWRSIPWGRALFSPSGARQVCEWLRYRVELFDGLAG
jgi:hypothetical protein